jgi:hypothetical protein
MTKRIKKLGFRTYRDQNRVDVRDEEVTRDGESDAGQNPTKNDDGNDAKNLKEHNFFLLSLKGSLDATRAKPNNEKGRRTDTGIQINMA